MPNVAIVTDSIACLPGDFVEQYKIGIVPIRLNFQGREYRDWVDISPNEAYQLFLKDPESFTTSPASPGHYLEVFQEANQQLSSWVNEGKIHLPKITTYPLEQVAEAHRALESGQTIGKLILTMDTA